MPDEGSFLQAILTNPTDDLPRLVYADWLEEQQTDEGNRKAEFLRVTVALLMETKTVMRIWMEHRLRELARHLPTDWLPVVSRLAVENCATAGNSLRQTLNTIEFEFECPIKWETLAPTGDVGVRHCGACKQKVYYCDTIDQAREHAQQGNCIAVDLALPRANGDLRALPVWMLGVMGKVSLASLERRREDKCRGELALQISNEREALKREQEAQNQRSKQVAQHERLRQWLRRRKA